MKNSTSTLLLIIALGIGFFYVYPSYGDIKKLSAEKDTFDKALVEAKELKDLQNTLLTKYQSLNEKDLENLKKVVPEFFDGEILVSIINSVASSHGMQLSQVSVLQDTQRQDPNLMQPSLYKKKEVSFVLKGDYKSFILSLQDMERSILIMDLKKISIKKDQKALSSNILEFEVVFNTYSIK